MRTEFERDKDGNYTVTVYGLKLSDTDDLAFSNGIVPEIEINVVDSRKISFKQRNKIFALLNDIYKHTGQPQEDMRQMFQFYLKMIRGYESFSLTNCTMTQARELIEIIISWCFLHGIPLDFKTAELLKEDKHFLYAATLNRKCVICGKHAHLAHRDAVGMGRNRNKIDHFGHRVLALCPNHHLEQHNIGVDSFDKKYHLENSWIKVTPEINKKLKGR